MLLLVMIRSCRARLARVMPVALVLMVLAATGSARAGDDYERWYTLQMMGKRAGYMQASQKTENGLITSVTKLVLGVGRGDAAIKVSIEGTFVETVDGKPVSMESVQSLGKTPVVTKYTFGPSAIEVVSNQAGQENRTEKPLPEGQWLTPAAATEYLRQRLGAGATEVVVRTVDPMTGADPATTTRKGIEATTADVMGKSVKAFECISTVSTAPGVESTEVVDEQGVPIRSTASLGGLQIQVEMSTREMAIAKGESPELMVRTFVRPDRKIDGARELREAVYVLRVPQGEMPELPRTGVQRVEKLQADTARVSVRLADDAGAEEGDAANEDYRKSAPLLNHEDPAVRKLVERAIKDAPEDKVERAEALRKFVHGFIRQKDLGVGFASASEVARSRQGDCTEHGMLLAAVLRADGIPSRVVSGVIYADQFAGEREIFGYHMWAQALLQVDGRWVWRDLDATLERPFDATHIALGVSALPDGNATASLSGLIPLLGRLEIKVEEAK
jgi:transglutaminase-like putative cysteine protease